ncbi:MAG TPA: glycoside hydrolase family 140 protein, partial [Verrucomicrobiota bacterium]|nr:glycoside hydrolase family 140 protein [Verrucomicrobiota bacterium]
HRNPYGDAAYVDSDLLRPARTAGADPDDAEQYDYWDHVDYAVEVAAKNGIYIALVPTWRDLVARETNLSADKVQAFATDLANHFKGKPNIIWVNGGSARPDRDIELWDALGKALDQADPNHLITFHPFGRTQSSEYFPNTSWLDVNMFVSGHRRYEQDNSGKKFGEDNWRYVLEDLPKTPRKPTIDGEPSYENLPQGIHDATQPYWTDSDVRRYAYWSVFAGACGHVYGENTVRQAHFQGVNKAESGAKLDFSEAMKAPGSSQMQHLKHLILSRPYFDRVNDQSAVAGDEGEKYDRILVTRGKDFLMAYNYTGREFTLKMAHISGKEVAANWFNPRTGEVTQIGTFKNEGSKTFDPPGEKANGNDWVLVLDDATKQFSSPGVL